MASIVPNLRNININRTYSKTIHLLVEMNNHIIEGLVDSGASMSIIIVSVFRELGIMHWLLDQNLTIQFQEWSPRQWEGLMTFGEAIYATWTSWLLTLMGMMCYLDYILNSFPSKSNSKSNDQQF
jgi:hypothetical protein